MKPSPAPDTDAAGINPLDALRILRSAGGALLAQAMLHGQLARVEWEEEKHRLLKMLGVALLGFACLLSVLLFGGILALAASWDTAYRTHAMLGVIALYGFSMVAAWRHFRALAALGAHSFVALREELAADIALLKKGL